MHSKTWNTLLQNQNLSNTLLWKKVLSTNIYSYTSVKRKEEKKIVSWHIKPLALSHLKAAQFALSRQHNVSSTAEFLKANIGTQSHSFLQRFPYY